MILQRFQTVRETPKAFTTKSTVKIVDGSGEKSEVW
jgi:hypothetical protein